VTGQQIVLSARARRDRREATGWWRQEGGAPLALRWVAAVKQALRSMGVQPNAGSPRYAIDLPIDRMRCWPVSPDLQSRTQTPVRSRSRTPRSA
jgi:plasmid stabilization system protein ParE